PQVRATNTGISAVIDPSGAILTRTDPDARAVLAATVIPDAHTGTLVLRWGDWLGPLAFGVGMALLLPAILPSDGRRRRGPGGVRRRVPRRTRRCSRCSAATGYPSSSSWSRSSAWRTS